MVQAVEMFKTYPGSVRNALIFLFSGWIWHYVSLYRYFFHGDLPANQIVIGVSLCYFVFRIKNWARILCIVCNILIIAMYLSVGFSFMAGGKIHFAVVSGINVVLFSLASFYLFTGATARYFKEHSPRPSEADEVRETRDEER